MKVFKSKLFYTIVLIVFTIIMVATVILKFALPSDSSKSGQGNMPSGFSSSDFSGFPQNGEGFTPGDNSDSNGGFSAGNMPGGFDSENMPSGFDPENMPEGFDKNSRPNRSSDSSSDSASGITLDEGDKDFSNFQPGNGNFPSRSSSKSNGFASVINKIWIPVVIVCALIDAVCIFMLIRLPKKNKITPVQINIGEKRTEIIPLGGQNTETTEETEVETPKRKKKLWILIFIPILAGAIILRMIPTTSKNTSSINVKEQLMTVDASTKSISNIYLSGGTLETESTKAFTLPGDITIESYAVSNGDIVKKGDLIARVDKSSVMIAISDIKTLIADLDKDLKKSASDNDYSKIKAPAAGRVKAIYAEAGKSVVDTMADNGALMLISLDGLMKVELTGVSGLQVGDTVTVRLSNDKEETGRVASVVDGTATITISDSSATYEDKVTVLDSDDKVIGTGELDINSCLKITGYQGITSKVNVKVGDSVKASAELITLTKTVHSADYDSLLNARKTLNSQMVKLFEIYETGEIRSESSGEISGLDESIPLDTTPSDYDSASAESELNKKLDPIVYFNNEGEDPVNPENPEGENSGENDPNQDPNQPTDPTQDPNTDPTNPSTDPSQPTDPTQDPQDPNTDPTNPSTDPSQNTDPNQSTDPNNQNVNPGQNGGQQNPNGQSQGQGSYPSFPSGAFSGGNFAISGIPSGYGNYSGYSNATAAAAATQQTINYKVTENTIYSIKAQNKMTIAISVDELDIRDLTIGQEVTVTLDALAGQSFKGTIVSIDSDGTYDSGNTKYSVSVSVDRTEQMLSGMNAGISIDMGAGEDCLTVPVSALIEKGGKTYVYTTYNEKNDELGGLKEVTTGRSNGTDVEILSGLESGEKVYYRYADSIEYIF